MSVQVEGDRRSVLARTDHLQEVLELSDRDRAAVAAIAAAAGCQGRQHPAGLSSRMEAILRLDPTH